MLVRSGDTGRTAIREATNAYVKGEKVTLESLSSYLQRGIPRRRLSRACSCNGGEVRSDVFAWELRASSHCHPGGHRYGRISGVTSEFRWRWPMARALRRRATLTRSAQLHRFTRGEAAGMFDADGVCLGFVRGPSSWVATCPCWMNSGGATVRTAHRFPGMTRACAPCGASSDALVQDVRRVLDEVGQRKGGGWSFRPGCTAALPRTSITAWTWSLDQRRPARQYHQYQ